MSRSTTRIQRAILSVTDKTGLVDFARQLSGLGIELISTGGTAKLLRDSGIAVKDISELTGFPEMLDGRVKTLHPKVHGGILHRRENPAHTAAVAEHGIQPIDMVVVNLYAFEKTAAKPGVAFEELIENIDIGGPSMIRSAAKNFHDVAVVTSPADYPAIADELARSGGSLSLETKWRLAQRAFATTAAYDSAIASTLERILDVNNYQLAASSPESFPHTLRLSFQKTLDLRYGENPHQKAAMYSDGSGVGVANARQLQGKELSYNNIVDLQAAWDLAQEFNEAGIDDSRMNDPFCAIIKHTNPAGAATGKTLAEAYQCALECDPVSAFGGVIGVNRPIDGEAAEEMHKLFLEVIAAPSFDDAAKASEALDIALTKRGRHQGEAFRLRLPGVARSLQLFNHCMKRFDLRFCDGEAQRRVIRFMCCINRRLLRHDARLDTFRLKHPKQFRTIDQDLPGLVLRHG